MSKKGGSGASFQKDVPWRASSSTVKPIPKIHHSPLLRVSQTPVTDYAVSVMRVSLSLSLSLPVFHFSSLRFNNPLLIFLGNCWGFSASRPYREWIGWRCHSGSSWSWLPRTWPENAHPITWPSGSLLSLLPLRLF